MVMIQRNRRRLLPLLVFWCLVVLATTLRVYAFDMTSTNFKIKDPVVGNGSGFGSSTSFDLLSSLHTNFSGTGSSTSFSGNYGFLYFPFVDDVVLTAVANGADGDLSWPAAQSSEGLGWTVDGYNTGIATVSGGPYTYTDVGNVTSYTYQDLAPGDYCFILQTYDALGYVIATSNEDCITIQPTLTFDIDTGVTDGETAAPYDINLGVIAANSVRVSGTTDGVEMVILEADTNSPGGIVVTVKNANGANGLVSTSTPANNINSADGTMSAGTENYGLCVMTAGLTGFSRATPYDSGTCATNTETNAIQGLTTTGENILTSGGSPVSNAHAEIGVQAAVSVSTPAHTDYGDILTFIVTPTF
jgi:hypothetical protein